MILVVTGPEILEPRLREHVEDTYLAAADTADVLRFGCAFGVDTWTYEAARRHLPKTPRELYVPGTYRHNAALVRAARKRGDLILRVDDHPTDASKTYMRRNERMVKGPPVGDLLLAFTPTSSMEIRSGPWATVRRAHKFGCVVVIDDLSGVVHEQGQDTQEPGPA